MTQHGEFRDDATLVALVLAGERDAFGPLFLRHSQSVLRLCQRLLGPTLDAQDVAQEAALEAFLRLADLREPARFGAWLHAIAANLARMALRRRYVLSLDTLRADASVVLLGVPVIPTPEDAYNAREMHDAIVAALNDLSAINREAVIGFFLKGYTYAELADLLGIPVSTVRGRLAQGRQKLRQALGPPVHQPMSGDRRSSNVRVKEITMPPPEFVEMELIGMRMVPFRIADKTWAVILREPNVMRELHIVLGATEVSAIQHARGEDWNTPPPLSADLMLQLFAPFAVKVERVVIHRLIEGSFYTTLTLVQSEQRSEIDMRPGAGLALAAASHAPIRVERSLLEELGVDTGAIPGEEHEPQFRLRLAARVEAAEVPVPALAPFTEEVQQSVDDCLAQLRAEVDAVNVVLMHHSGALGAAQSPINSAALAHYSKALAVGAQNPPDVAELGRYTGLLMDDLFTPEAWVLFWQWSGWLLQISGVPNSAPNPDVALVRLKRVAHELERLLAGPTA